jgi:hypothetical protein
VPFNKRAGRFMWGTKKTRSAPAELPPPPDWAVTCARLPQVVHVRDDGHFCELPMRAAFDGRRELVPSHVALVAHRNGAAK